MDWHARPEFPRSGNYDPEWMLENQMGPNALWLMEWLCQEIEITPDMSVLDLGCGRAMTSVFLAREFRARIFAADLWMSPDQNWVRAREAGVSEAVCPVRAEAHGLPFAQGFFDAVVSVDAYHYFGTDDLYLGYLAGFVRPGGMIGIVVPGLMQDIRGEVPPHLTEPQSNGKAFWEDECWCFHTADWWRDLWGRCGKVAEVQAEALPDGWRHWRDFERAMEKAGKNPFPSDAEALDLDKGEYMGFVRVLATRTEAPGANLYDPSLGVRVGIDP